MNKTFLALALTAFSSSSFAYNTQLDAGFTYFDHDNDWIDSHGLFEAKGTYYLAPVETKTAPLNEAAFLGHNSNVYAKYSYQYWNSEDYYDEYDIGVGIAKDETDTHKISAGVEYYLDQIYLNGEIGFGRQKDKYQVQFDDFTYNEKNDYDVTLYRAMVGFMPLTNLLLAAGIDGYKGDGDDKDNALALRAKYVAPIGQDGQFINLEADGTFGDLDTITLGADYYFDQTFSIGAAYNKQDDGDFDTDSFAVRTKYFINPSLAVGGAVGFGDDVQNLNLNATFRF